jgi:quercetin dioxygenase-like cupin family protein
MIAKRADTLSRDLQPGVTHTVLSYGDLLMLCEVTIAKGVTFPDHSHPHTQAVYVISGTVSFTLGDELVELAAGDSCLVQPHLVHGLTALTDARVLDTFTPVREDFVPFGPRR